MPRRPRATMSRRLRLAALVAIAACARDEGSAVTSPPLSLSPADQLAVAGQLAVPVAATIGVLAPNLSVAGAGTRLDGRLVALSPSAASIAPVTIPVDRTAPCPAGGSVRTSGSIAGDVASGGSASLTAALTSTFAACGIPSDGRTLLLTTDPGLTVSFSYLVTDRVPADTQTLSIVGTVGVSVSGSRAVAIPCAVELTVSTTASTRVVLVTGTVCGSAVSRQLLWTP